MNILIAGASGGIGRALTEHFDVEVNTLYLTYRSRPQRIFVPQKAMTVQHCCDFTRDVEVGALYGHIRSLDVIINCMGHAENRLIVNMDEDQWDRVVASNLKTVFLSCKYGAPLVTQGGHIINVSSVLGAMGMPGAANYCAAKGAVEAFTRAFAIECLIGRRVFVNALALGYFNIGLGLGLSENIKKAMTHRIPLGEFGDPGEITRAVDFIIASRYMTGSILQMNGGLCNS